MVFKSGFIPSPPDYRDWQYGLLFAAGEVPVRFSLRDRCGPVRDQGKHGSCVGQACSGVKDTQEQKVTSPRYVYEWSKRLDGIPGQEGTYPRVAMQVLLGKGICLESTLPYEEMTWPLAGYIPEAADTEAAKMKIGAYARVQTLAEIKQALVTSGPLVAGVLVCQSFVDAPGGFVPIPGSGGVADYVLGGHGICIVGYDDELAHGPYKGFLIFKNSWGTGWGDGGFGYIPYDFLAWRDDLGMTAWLEAWSCVDVITPNPACKDVILWIGKKIALVDGAYTALDVAPTIVPEAGRTLVPLRFLAENMGYTVDWNPSDQSIHFYRR